MTSRVTIPRPNDIHFLFFSLLCDNMFSLRSLMRPLLTHIPDIGSMRLYVLFFMLLLFLVFVKYFLDKGKLCFGPPHKSTAIISDWVFMSVVCKCVDISMTNTCQMLLHDGGHRWYNTSCLLWLKKQSHWCSPYSRRRSTKRSENICWFTVFVNGWNWSNFIEIQK